MFVDVVDGGNLFAASRRKFTESINLTNAHYFPADGRSTCHFSHDKSTRDPIFSSHRQSQRSSIPALTNSPHSGDENVQTLVSFVCSPKTVHTSHSLNLSTQTEKDKYNSQRIILRLEQIAHISMHDLCIRYNYCNIYSYKCTMSPS